MEYCARYPYTTLCGVPVYSDSDSDSDSDTQHVYGWSLAGAGGGGFMVLLMKEKQPKAVELVKLATLMEMDMEEKSTCISKMKIGMEKKICKH